MDNPENLAALGTQDEETQNKNTTQYALDTTMRQANTNNINKTCALHVHDMLISSFNISATLQ